MEGQNKNLASRINLEAVTVRIIFQISPTTKKLQNITEMPTYPIVRTQRTWARLAGFLFLWLIITGLAGALTTSRIAGSGTFAETAKRITASERFYRIALCSELIETLSALLLAFALYVTLKPVNKLLAQIAMYWRLGESLIGCVGMI